MSETGDAIRPLRTDDRLIANETTSLCSEQAWRDVRIAFQPTSEATPSLILLSTDGYANSYKTDEDFLKVGSDIQKMIANNGLGYVRDNMESWLKQVSESGSGDDVTLGLLIQIAYANADAISSCITEAH